MYTGEKRDFPRTDMGRRVGMEDDPSWYTSIETNISDRIARVQVPGFVGSRTGAPPPRQDLSQFPTPAMSYIPNATRTMPMNGMFPAMTDINRMGFNARRVSRYIPNQRMNQMQNIYNSYT
jgi:hypothetical protein